MAAVRGWSFLVSTLPAYSLSTGFVEDSLATLAGLLYSDSVDTRAAAGEAIALLYDAAGIAGLEGDSGMLQPLVSESVCWAGSAAWPQDSDQAAPIESVGSCCHPFSRTLQCQAWPDKWYVILVHENQDVYR